MPDENVIRVTTQVDTAGLRSGLEEAKTIDASALGDIRSQHAAAAAAIKQATATMVEAQAALGPAAAAGNKVAQEALAQYEAELASATVAEAELKAAITQTTIATEISAVSTRNLAAAHGHAVSQVQAASGALRVLEGNGGIRAAERLLTTIPGVGSALQVAFPVFGAVALAEAVGHITEKFVKLYEEIHSAKERISGEFRDITLAVQASNDALRVTNDRLADDIAKLEHRPQNTLKLAIDEAVVSADNLARSLEKDLKSLDDLLKKESFGTFKGFITGRTPTGDIAKEIGGETGYGGFRGRVSEATDQGRARIKAAQDLPFDQELVRAAAQTELNTNLTRLYDEEIKKLSKSYEEVQAHAKLGAEIGGLASDTDRLELLKQTISNLKEEREGISLNVDHADLQGRKADLIAKKDLQQDALAALRKNQQDIKAGYDEMLADLKSDHEVTKSEELAFRQNELAEVSQWGRNYVNLQRQINREIGTLQQDVFKQQDAEAKRHIAEQKRLVDEGAQLAETAGAESGQGGANAKLEYLQQALDDFSDLPDVYRAILAKIPEATRAAMRENSEQLKAAVNEQYEIWITGDRRTTQEIKSFWQGVLQVYSTDAALVAEATKKVAEATSKLRDEETKLADLKLKGQETAELGGISQQRLEIQRTTTLSGGNQSNAEKVRQLEQLRQLDQQEADIRINDEKKILANLKAVYKEESKEYQAEANKLVQIQQQADQKQYADTTKIIAQQQVQYRQFFQTLTQDFNRNINSWIQGQKTFAAAMRDTWKSIVMLVIEDIEKMGEKWLIEHVLMAAVNKIFHTEQVALQAATTATNSAKNVAMASSDAAVAGGAAFASVIEALPFPVNVAVAPGVAAATLAQGLTFAGLAAFEVGTHYVPNTGVALVHQGERIVDSRSNESLTKALAAGAGSSGGDTHQHFNLTYNAAPGSGGSQKADAHALYREVVKMSKRFNR